MSQIVFGQESLITPDAIANEFASHSIPPRQDEAQLARAELALILSIATLQFEQGRDVATIIKRTNADLHKLRAKVHPGVWRELIPVVQGHAVSEFFLQDPFTRWSSQKPRGYSGDAHLLDFIYGHPSVAGEIDKASALGRQLYDSTRDSQSSNAVRERRDLVAQLVDDIAAEKDGETEVLSIAAGHLREAERSFALRDGKIKRWVALDQDPLSVESIATDFADTSVEAVAGSVRGLLTKGYKLGQFDLVYSTGLYDYLSQNVAVKLTQKCLELLKPDGLLLFANFAAGIPDDGFMETFMNWPLLLRSESDMWSIINASVDRNTVEARVHRGANRNIIYATIRKRARNGVAPATKTLGQSDRFELVMEPTYLWLVWDMVTDLPAEFDGLELFGLSHNDALRYCEQLNRAGLSHYQIDSYS
jgi:SAM-dependent methyltransferase